MARCLLGLRFSRTWRGMILWGQLLGLSIDKLVYCVVQGSLFHQNSSCTFINLPLVPVINLNNQRMVYHVITPNMILDCSHLPRPLIWFPSVIYLNISIAIVLMFFPPWYIIHIKYKRTTSLATVSSILNVSFLALLTRGIHFWFLAPCCLQSSEMWMQHQYLSSIFLNSVLLLAIFLTKYSFTRSNHLAS